MSHDFKTAVVELRGVTQTHRIEKPYGEKNIDVLCERFANSLESGTRHPALPSMRDAALASEYAWTFFYDSLEHDLPAIGDLGTLQKIRERRKNLKTGYGLIRQRS